jgi:fused signal recognition particle receptor
LQAHAEKLGVELIKHDYGADPAAVAFDAIKHAKAKNIDVVLIDTAGRQHANVDLMAELQKIKRVTKPQLTILTVDSLTGNDAVEQARLFNEKIGIDGSILSKVDADEKGGALLSVAYTTKKPILFLGMGQRYEDIEKFEADKIVSRILG